MPAVLLALGGFLFYALVGCVILSFVPKAHGAELPKIPPEYQWESCTWTGEKWTACKMVPKTSSESGVAGTHYRGGPAIGSSAGVCAGQMVPWASTFLCYENGSYTKVWNTVTRAWRPYYPMGAAVSAAPTVIVVPVERRSHCDDPIRAFKRMMREIKRFGDSHHGHHRSYRHRRYC